MKLTNIGLSLLTATILLCQSGDTNSAEFQTKDTYPRQVLKQNPMIKLDWRPALGSVVVTVSTGCLTSSAQDLHDSLALTLDGETRTLRIEGYFIYTLMSMMVKKDCSKATSQHLLVRGVEPGRYHIRLNDKAIGHLNLGKEAIFQHSMR